MKRLFALAVCCVLTLGGMTGCSGNLARWKAKRLILAGLEPHPIGPNKIKAPYVPGFEPADLADFSSDPSYFVLDTHKPYGEPIGLEKYHFDKQHTPNDEEFLVEALTNAGYLTIQEEGPTTVSVNGSSLAYSHSRTINFTQKIGKVTQQDSSDRGYATGFSCYPGPEFRQCNLPPIFELDSKNFTITGITQDDAAHAKVSIMVPWKLTSLGKELQPFAKSVQESESKRSSDPKYDSSYFSYPTLYRWEHFLSHAQDKGNSPATILFQKFDDGWRIVDEKGRSEKDIS